MLIVRCAPVSSSLCDRFQSRRCGVFLAALVASRCFRADAPRVDDYGAASGAGARHEQWLTAVLDIGFQGQLCGVFLAVLVTFFCHD